MMMSPRSRAFGRCFVGPGPQNVSELQIGEGHTHCVTCVVGFWRSSLSNLFKWSIYVVLLLHETANRFVI